MLRESSLDKSALESQKCLVDFERSQQRILFNERLEGAHEKRFIENRTSLDGVSNHRKPVDIKFDGYSKRTGLFQKVCGADTEKSRVKTMDANSGVYYNVD